MNNDHSFHNTGSSQILLTHDRRSDVRRSSRATIWLLDDDLLRAQELGAVIEISRGGLSMRPCEDFNLRLDSLKPGQEWLVMLDDPTGIDPLADQRVAVIRLLRVESASADGLHLAFSFVSRKVGRCLPGRNLRSNTSPDAISDNLAGDLLDELVERVQRDMAATIRSEAQ